LTFFGVAFSELALVPLRLEGGIELKDYSLRKLKT